MGGIRNRLVPVKHKGVAGSKASKAGDTCLARIPNAVLAGTLVGCGDTMSASTG